MIYYLEPNFVEIQLRESGFSIQGFVQKENQQSGRRFETVHFFIFFR